MPNLALKLALGSLLVMAPVVIDGAQNTPGRTSLADLPNPATIDRNGVGRTSPAVAHIRVPIADAAQ